MASSLDATAHVKSTGQAMLDTALNSDFPPDTPPVGTAPVVTVGDSARWTRWLVRPSRVAYRDPTCHRSPHVPRCRSDLGRSGEGAASRH